MGTDLRHYVQGVIWSSSQMLTFPISRDKQWSPEPLYPSPEFPFPVLPWLLATSLFSDLSLICMGGIMGDNGTTRNHHRIHLSFIPWAHSGPLLVIILIPLQTFIQHSCIYWALTREQNMSKMSGKTHQGKAVECAPQIHLDQNYTPILIHLHASSSLFHLWRVWSWLRTPYVLAFIWSRSFLTPLFNQ